MLWRPYAPIYPKLVKNVADGLTFEETKELRNKGLNSHPLMRLSKSELGSEFRWIAAFHLFHSKIWKEVNSAELECWILFAAAKNGVYVNVVGRVREAFETEEVVRLDCTHVGTSDCKKIGVKLRVWLVLETWDRPWKLVWLFEGVLGVYYKLTWLFLCLLCIQDLVPCIPTLFKDEQIILWRGKTDCSKTSENWCYTSIDNCVVVLEFVDQVYYMPVPILTSTLVDNGWFLVGFKSALKKESEQSEAQLLDCLLDWYHLNSFTRCRI